jgi:hypothetical protein
MGNPTSIGVQLGKNDVRFNVEPKDADGNPVTGAVITWASDNPAVLTVHESNALFLPEFPPGYAALGQPVAAGTAVVTATCGAVSDSIGRGSQPDRDPGGQDVECRGGRKLAVRPRGAGVVTHPRAPLLGPPPS